MALTIRSAERITGCKIDVIEADDTHFVEASKDGVPVALGQGRDLKTALKEVLDAVYKSNSAQARERDEHRCSRCGKLGPIQSHHGKFRSHGRDDDPDNLISLCPACHLLCHGG